MKDVDYDNQLMLASTALARAARQTTLPGSGRPLSKTEKLVLVELASRADIHTDGRVYAQEYVKTLSRSALCTRDYARRATKVLSASRLLYTITTTGEDKGYESNRYYFPLFEEAITGKPFVMPEGKPAFE